MKDRYLVGENINLVCLSGKGNVNINLSFRDKTFQNAFLNPSPDFNDSLSDYELFADVQKVSITDAGLFPTSTTQYFATVIESNNDDIIGSFSQGIFYNDVDFNKVNCFVWTIAHPLTRYNEYIEYNTLKYILSVKSVSNMCKGQSLIEHIDTYLNLK